MLNRLIISVNLYNPAKYSQKLKSLLVPVIVFLIRLIINLGLAKWNYLVITSFLLTPFFLIFSGKAYCRKPEDPPQGTFGPRKTEYDVGDRISLICYRGYEQSSKVRPKCMKNGTWSDVGLECRPKKTFRLTDRKKTDNVIVIEKPVTRIATTTTTITMTPTTTTSTTTTTTSTTTTTTTTEVTTQQPRHTEDISVGATTEVLWENFDDYNVTEHQGNDNDTEFFYIVDEQPSLQA